MLRLVFFGTAEWACRSLQALAGDPGLELALVVTQPDRARGRDLRLQPTPVKACALELGLPVSQPERCRQPEFLRQVGELRPDLVVVAAYGQILPQALLDIPARGALNVHGSLLPRHRGAAPIQWSILAGDSETGVTIMQMDAGLDTGGILAQERTPISPEDDAQTLHDRLAALGASLLVRTIAAWLNGAIQPRPQPAEGITYARKIVKEDGHLDWSLPAEALRNRVRAFTPWPGAWTALAGPPGPMRLRVWRASVLAREAPPGLPGVVLRASADGIVVGCGGGTLALTEVQREGGKRLAASAFLAGHPLASGCRFA